MFGLWCLWTIIPWTNAHNVVLLCFVTAHPEDGQARPKHVGATNWENIYHHLCILFLFISNLGIAFQNVSPHQHLEVSQKVWCEWSPGSSCYHESCYYSTYTENCICTIQHHAQPSAGGPGVQSCGTSPRSGEPRPSWVTIRCCRISLAVLSAANSNEDFPWKVDSLLGWSGNSQFCKSHDSQFCKQKFALLVCGASHPSHPWSNHSSPYFRIWRSFWRSLYLHLKQKVKFALEETVMVQRGSRGVGVLFL